MDVNEKFRFLADEWEQHCRSVANSSDIADYLRSPGLPFADRARSHCDPLDLPALSGPYPRLGLRAPEVTGVRVVTIPNWFSPADVHRRWVAWWEEEQAGLGL